MEYTIYQWLLFFFIYSAIGWIWEVSLVLVRDHKWVNRGFLHGPMLPIYGSGAFVILFLTLPYRDNLLYIFVLGMLGASILEYLTGAFMLKAYKMRYWDYSHHKFNLQGHISVGVSLVWGLFSLLLVKVLHLPFEQFVLSLPVNVTETVSSVLFIVFVVDMTLSIQQALDMREIITYMSANIKGFKIIEENVTKISNSMKKSSDSVKQQLKQISEEMSESMGFKPQTKTFLDRLEERKTQKSRIISLLQQKIDISTREVRVQMLDPTCNYEQLEKKQQDLLKSKTRLDNIEKSLCSIRESEYRLLKRVLRRNPSAKMNPFQDAEDEKKEK